MRKFSIGYFLLLMPLLLLTCTNKKEKVDISRVLSSIQTASEKSGKALFFYHLTKDFNFNSRGICFLAPSRFFANNPNHLLTIVLPDVNCRVGVTHPVSVGCDPSKRKERIELSEIKDVELTSYAG